MSAITRGYILYLERTRQYRPHTVSGGFGTISPSNRCTKVTPRWRKTIPIRYIETNCIINTYLHVEYMWNNCVLYIYIEYIYTYIYIYVHTYRYIYIYYISILHMNMYIYMYIIALPHLERMLLSKKKKTCSRFHKTSMEPFISGTGVHWFGAVWNFLDCLIDLIACGMIRRLNRINIHAYLKSQWCTSSFALFHTQPNFNV